MRGHQLQRGGAGIVCLSLAAIMFGSFAHAAESNAIAKFEKKVAAMLRKGKGEWYVLQLTQTTYQPNAYRLYARPQNVNGKVVMVLTKEFAVEPMPVPAAKFVVVEGTEAATRTVVRHMAPAYEKPAKGKKGRDANPQPTPELSWDYLGRVADAEEAQQLSSEAQALFDTQPFWKAERPRDE